MKIEVGLIRVLTIKNKKLLSFHGQLIENYFPGLRVTSKCIEDQPDGIHNEETKKTAVPKIIELGRKMEKENIRAIVISCADDPGVDKLRKMVNIPVIGAGSSAASLALAYGSKIGTLGISENAPEIMKEILGKHLVAEAKPEGVETSLDLMTEEGKKNVIKAGEYLQKRGADVIALACTGYSTMGASRFLEKTLNIPIIDPVIAAGLFTWYFTARRGSGSVKMKSEK